MKLLQQKLTTFPRPFITSLQDPNITSTNVKTRPQICAATMMLLLLVRIKNRAVRWPLMVVKTEFHKNQWNDSRVKLKECTQTYNYLICTQMFKVHSLPLNILNDSSSFTSESRKHILSWMWRSIALCSVWMSFKMITILTHSPNGSCSNSLHQIQCLVYILSEHSSSQTIVCFVGPVNELI